MSTRQQGSCPAGEPVPGSTCESWTSLGREVEAGQHGELVARGANVMRGYWNNPQETSRAFQNGMFRTGDVGYRDADGYFYILDRLKDMIVTGGENVYSGEVEAVIYQHPAVLEAAVFGIPDPQWGELVTACIVRKPGQALGADELIVHCRRFLANYKIPRRVEFSETELPKGGSGKILKRPCGSVSGPIRNGRWLDAWRKISFAEIAIRTRPGSNRNCDTKGQTMTVLQATRTKASSARPALAGYSFSN